MLFIRVIQCSQRSEFGESAMGISLASRRDWDNMQFNSLEDLNITIARMFNTVFLFNTVINIFLLGDSGSTVVKVLCYKSEGRWCQWIFLLT